MKLGRSPALALVLFGFTSTHPQKPAPPAIETASYLSKDLTPAESVVLRSLAKNLQDAPPLPAAPRRRVERGI
jgi:hypothetical protein